MASLDDALRLGWLLAEIRGLTNPDGPRPESTELPESPAGLLPLRSQRTADAARRACAGTVVDLAGALGLDDGGFVAGVDAAVGAAGERTAWPAHRRFFHDWDERIQNELTRRDEHLANAYLLGRGLAECYWALERDPGGGAAIGPAFLLGSDRRRELTRMLGRLEGRAVHPLTPAVVSGSLEAWGTVVEDPAWLAVAPLEPSLYEQVRRWYQLMVLRQDPTTLVLPYSRLGSLRQLKRNLRLVWPQALLGIVAVVLATWLLSVLDGDSTEWPQSLLATGGAWLVVVGGLMARARNAAQLWATRLRQDAYTDLVAIDCTFVPDPPPASRWKWFRRRRPRVESAVRKRRLTPSTFVPDVTPERRSSRRRRRSGSASSSVGSTRD